MRPFDFSKNPAGHRHRHRQRIRPLASFPPSTNFVARAAAPQGRGDKELITRSPAHASSAPPCTREGKGMTWMDAGRRRPYRRKHRQLA